MRVYVIFSVHVCTRSSMGTVCSSLRTRQRRWTTLLEQTRDFAPWEGRSGWRTKRHADLAMQRRRTCTRASHILRPQQHKCAWGVREPGEGVNGSTTTRGTVPAVVPM